MVWESIDWDATELQEEARNLVTEMGATNTPPFHTLSPETARSIVMDDYPFSSGDAADVHSRDYTLDGHSIPLPGEFRPADRIPIRIYTPTGDGPFPVVVYCHGGGFFSGTLNLPDGFCRTFADAANAVIVSVGYRLAPEHPFPAALEDCYAVTKWATINATVIGGDPERIAICGESSGGNLAAAVTFLARDFGEPELSYQVITYPLIAPDDSRPSYAENPLKRKDMNWYRSMYVDTAVDFGNEYAFPLLANDMSGLPPGEVVTVEFDVLRDEGIEYAERLQEAGVDVEHTHYDDDIHPFYVLDMDRSREATRTLAQNFRSRVGT